MWREEGGKKEWGEEGVFIGFLGLCQGLVSVGRSGLGCAGLELRASC